jgi:hypothetical protein
MNKTKETVTIDTWEYDRELGKSVKTKTEEWSKSKADYIFDRNITKPKVVNENQHLRNLLKM